MNGAELLVKTAVTLGVKVCFANPGTTEMPIVVALDSTPGIRAFLGLFEGVCTGAADGYGRMLDRPAMTLLHLGPGLGNGIANLHNARRARSPLLNVIGEHATWHREADPPLAMDIEGLAKTVSGWFRTSCSAQAIGADTAEAVAAAWLGQVATLIVPNDHQLGQCGEHQVSKSGISYDLIDPDSIKAAASRLQAFRNVALILGGRALRKPGLAAAARIKKTIGCDLFSRTLSGYMECGSGLPVVGRIPYFPEQATALLSPYEAILLAGTPEPVTFFGYPGVRSRILTDEQVKITLCTERQNVVEALEYLANALGAPAHLTNDDQIFAKSFRPSVPSGDLTAEKACQTLAALQPENAIIVDEAVSTGFFYYPFSSGLPPHSQMYVAGGAIGQGLPCATGAAIACPDRPVINLQADGSAMYTVQALWTQAHEGLNIITLICSNRSYRILQVELNRAGITSFGPNTRALTELTKPVINWVKTAQGFGVPGLTVSTAEELARELGRALAEPGPHLIGMLLP
ncbi:MAG TPA: acetolactate synthase large subunit [Thermodesulfobacteriota bacterium]|nr:acetolactate synthase large subunit [Thermodesulfobacteriota bacterium]